MPLRKMLHLICLICTALFLLIGHARSGPGIALAAGLATLGIWLLAYKWPASELPAIALVITVGLAVLGLYLGASALLMLTVATLALVDWDLAMLDRMPPGGQTVRGLTLLEKKHFQSLLLAIGLALPAMMIGRLIHFQIPFGAMILLVVLGSFSLTRVWTLFSK